MRSFPATVSVSRTFTLLTDHVLLAWQSVGRVVWRDRVWDSGVAWRSAGQWCGVKECGTGSVAWRSLEQVVWREVAWNKCCGVTECGTGRVAWRSLEQMVLHEESLKGGVAWQSKHRTRGAVWRSLEKMVWCIWVWDRWRGVAECERGGLPYIHK